MTEQIIKEVKKHIQKLKLFKTIPKTMKSAWQI